MNQFAQILASVQDILRTDSGGDETVEAVTSNWNAGLQVLIRKTREAKLVAYVPSNELNNVFTEEQLELLADAGITEDGGDSRRISLGGVTTACIGFDYDKLRLEAKSETSGTYLALKAKVVDLQRELELAKHSNKADSALVRLLDTLSVEIASRGQSNRCNPLPAVICREGQSASGVPTLLLSDWEWGDVSSEGGASETYNVDIAQRRAKRVFTNAGESLAGDGAYEGFVCALGGNLLSTSARQRMTDNEFVDVVLALHDSLLQGIRWLSEQFGHVYVPCVSSGRLAENGDNLDWLVYRMLERSFAGDPTCNVKFDISGQQDLRFDVYGTRYLLTGAGHTKQRASQALGRGDYDYLVCGHVDAGGTANGRITNGSLQGAAVGRPGNGIKVSQQSLWVTHPQFGVTKQIPVFGEVPTAPMHLPPAISSYSRTCN